MRARSSNKFVPAIYVDRARCIGCNSCSLACRQENNFENSPAAIVGARTRMAATEKWNEVYHYEEGGYPAVRAQVIALTREQCTMCAHRLAIGLLPACVITCMGITREFGDYEELQRKYPEAEYMAAGLHKRVLLGNLAEKKPSLESSPPPPSGYVPANDCRVCHR
ncbi:MAG: 4Fe-4S dicluster domain-containing protein [Vicinamibacterales bacterium]